MVNKCLNIPIRKNPYEVGDDLGGVTVNKKKVIFDVFFREKPAMMLVELKNANDAVYASVLAKQIDCTYSHVLRFCKRCKKQN